MSALWPYRLNLFMLRVLLLSTFCLWFSLSPFGQSSPYPQKYFRDPLGIPLELVANFGELRPNHWHMGLDIRTQAKENLPVYAAADGFISHIGVRPQSFGRFIIIDHPNGMSTLYGHLNDFFPGLEEYVRAKQSENKSWEIELDPGPKKFPVTKGAFIAYSGNTGGSQGPHLHFEIFDTKTQIRFNPLLFGFDIPDKETPSIVKLAIYDRGRSTYGQAPLFIPVKYTDSGYIIPKNTLLRTGFRKLSFAIEAYDRMHKGGSPDGVYEADLYQDSAFVSGFTLDKVGYNETMRIEAHIDHPYRYNGGAFLQHLSALPGDQELVYHKGIQNGLVELNDTLVHDILIKVLDVAGNSSTLRFKVKFDEGMAPVSYGNRGEVFVPGKMQWFRRPDFEARFSSTAFYDTLPVVYLRIGAKQGGFSMQHQLNSPAFPLHDEATIRIKPTVSVPPELKDKLVMLRADAKGFSVKKPVWDGEWLQAKFGDQGTYQLQLDTTAPFIPSLGKGDTIDLSPVSRIIITPADNFGQIRNFHAEIDGQWVRFTNDKSRSWVYFFDEQCPYGLHEIKITAEDLVGNSNTKTWWFKRYPYTPPPKKKYKTKTKTKNGKTVIKKKKK